MNSNGGVLNGQVALVTGANKGIGRACALALANAGADIVLGQRKTSLKSDLIEEINQLGRQAIEVQMDMSNLSEIADAIGQCISHFKKLDILVNNVGIGFSKEIINVTEDEFDLTLNTNLKGTFFASQIVGKEMIKQGKGCIINIGSQAGYIALQQEAVYCMTKAAISHLTKCMALEWAKFNIRVNAVAPTFIDTPGTREYLDNVTNYIDVINSIPLGRIGKPSEVADPVVFLASEGASLITGTTLMVDGGWTIQ